MTDSKKIRKAAKDRKLKEARLRFRTLLLANPNHFGNLVDSSFEPILPIQNNKYYEELGCVGYQPQQGQLEAVVYVKQPSGYSGRICESGSLEFVRFYLSYDNGASWEDQGLSTIHVWDIPEATEGKKRLEYAASLKVDPPRKFCIHENVIQVRAILSWNNPPPPNQPNWVPVWGEVQDAFIQVESRKLIPQKELLSAASLKLPQEINEIIDLDTVVPVKPKLLGTAELAKLYKDKGVPVHRFAFKELMQSIDQPVTLDPSSLQALIPGIQIDPGIFELLFPKTDGDVSYEELKCIGLDPNTPDTLVGIIQVKKPSGYSGGPCTSGSREHVTFWGDFDGNGSFETCLGTASVTVYDLSKIPSKGIYFAVRLPVDFSKYRERCKKGATLVRIRAILSWSNPVPCNNPGQIPTWGNREETTIHIAPHGAINEVAGKIAILGGIPTQHINDLTGLTTATAVFATNNLPPDPDPDFLTPGNQGQRPCPFARRVSVQGAPVTGYSYIVEVSPDNSIWTPVLKDLVVTDQNGNTSTHKADPNTKRFSYLNFNNNINALLAQWDSAGNDLWYVRLSVYDNSATLVSTDVHRIQLHNTKPEVSIEITSGAGNCGKFGTGETMLGNYVVRDNYLGSYSLGVEPAVNPPGVGIPDPRSGIVQTAPAPGDNWELDTTNMQSCGYVIRVVARNRSIVSSQSVGLSDKDSAGFCLEDVDQ